MAEESPKQSQQQSTALSPEERRKLSEKNRVKSNHHANFSNNSKNRKKKSQSAPPPTPPQPTQAERNAEKARQEAQEREAKKARLAKSAENRAKAERKKQSAQQSAPPEKESRHTTTAAAVAHSKMEAPQRMKESSRERHPSNFQTREIRIQKPPKPQTVRGKRFTDHLKPHFSHRSASSPKAILLGICALALVGFVIYGRVQINEIYSILAERQAVYDDSIAKNVSMRSEMEGKMTVKNIEEYAEEELGLKLLDQSQIQYIQIQTEDEVQIAEEETNLFVRLHEQLLNIWEFIKGE